MMGRLLYQNKPNMQSFYIETTNINRGSILLVNATLENGTVIRKKTMRY
jgi:hypothetical protein